MQLRTRQAPSSFSLCVGSIKVLGSAKGSNKTSYWPHPDVHEAALVVLWCRVRIGLVWCVVMVCVEERKARLHHHFPWKYAGE